MENFFFSIGLVTNKQLNCLQGVALSPDPCQLLFFHKTVPRLCSHYQFQPVEGRAVAAVAIAPFHCGPPTASAAPVAAHLQPCVPKHIPWQRVCLEIQVREQKPKDEPLLFLWLGKLCVPKQEPCSPTLHLPCSHSRVRLASGHGVRWDHPPHASSPSG